MRQEFGCTQSHNGHLAAFTGCRRSIASRAAWRPRAHAPLMPEARPDVVPPCSRSGVRHARRSRVVRHSPARTTRAARAAVDPELFADMSWRNIGPYRAGRTKAAAGTPASRTPSTSGWCNGGVWKTTDAGRTWKPIFDDQPTGSIGWVAVAPSDPEHPLRRQRRRPAAPGPRGRRRHLQIDRRRHRPGRISACATRSRSPSSPSIRRIPNRLFVAALGHPYGPNEERGIFRSTDGGQTLRARALQGREHRRQGRRHRSVEPRHRLRDDVGAAAGAVGKRRVGRHQRRHLQVDRRRHDVEAADAGTARRHRQRRARDRAEQSAAALRDASRRAGNGTGLYRSTTPARRGREHDRSAADQPDQRGRAARAPQGSDTLIVTDVVSYKSTDGGKTFVPFKGAPGGDDNQNIWWNPDNPDIMLLVVDQGAVVTLNGGQTWSSPRSKGIVGGIYAREEGHPEAVWQAIYDQYQPASTEDAIPRGRVGRMRGLPTGSIRWSASSVSG